MSRPTRAVRAQELLRLLQRGPSYLTQPLGCNKEEFDRWAGSWVLPLLAELVPELKGTKLP